MKAQIVKGTTIGGKSVNPGDVVELDKVTFGLLKGQGQAIECEPEPTQLEVEPKQATSKPTKFQKRK